MFTVLSWSAVVEVLSSATRSEPLRGRQRERGGGEKERHSPSDQLNFVPPPLMEIVTKQLLE